MRAPLCNQVHLKQKANAEWRLRTNEAFCTGGSPCPNPAPSLLHVKECVATAIVGMQDATMSDEMGEEVISESRQHQQQQELQQQVSVEDALQPWQARLAGHAEAIQQLDRDSLCRISDPCHQPSKRSRSCPPDSFGAAPLAPAESTDAMHVMQSDDTISQGDETMSSEASDIHSAMQTGHIAQSNTVQREPAPADDSTRLCQATAQVKQLAGSHQASAEPPSSKLVAQHLDSLDMTQPNLTPADQRRRLQVSSAQGSTDPGTAPVRPFPCTSPLRQGAGVGPDLDCNRVAAAGPNSGCPQPDAILAATAIAQPNQRQQQQEIVRKGSGLFGAGKGKAAKWKQRAGVRDTGFGENEQPMLVPPGMSRSLGAPHGLTRRKRSFDAACCMICRFLGKGLPCTGFVCAED